jgi:hypothetical protein
VEEFEVLPWMCISHHRIPAFEVSNITALHRCRTLLMVKRWSVNAKNGEALVLSFKHVAVLTGIRRVILSIVACDGASSNLIVGLACFRN